MEYSWSVDTYQLSPQTKLSVHELVTANVGRNRKPATELIPELLDSEVKARLEGADVILRLRLVDAPLDQCKH